MLIWLWGIFLRNFLLQKRQTKLSWLSCNLGFDSIKKRPFWRKLYCIDLRNSTVFLWQIWAWITTPTRAYSFLGIWNANFEDSFCDVCAGYRPRAQTRTPSPRILRRSSSQSPATNRKRLEHCNQKGNNFLRLSLLSISCELMLNLALAPSWV